MYGATAASALLAGCSILGGSDGETNGTATDGETETAAGEATPTAAGEAAGTTVQATTAAATPTMAATEASTPMATETTGERTPGGGTDVLPVSGTPPEELTVDLSEVTTYSNDAYAYAIDYPSALSVDESAPEQVSFTSPSVPVIMLTQATGGIGGDVGLESIVPAFLNSFQRSFDAAEFEVVNRESVTLPNDQPGQVVDIEIQQRGDSTVLRGKFVFALANEALYVTVILLPKSVYTDEIEGDMTAIAESFTIEEASVGGQTTTG